MTLRSGNNINVFGEEITLGLEEVKQTQGDPAAEEQRRIHQTGLVP